MTHRYELYAPTSVNDLHHVSVKASFNNLNDAKNIMAKLLYSYPVFLNDAFIKDNKTGILIKALFVCEFYKVNP